MSALTNRLAAAEKHIQDVEAALAVVSGLVNAYSDSYLKLLADMKKNDLLSRVIALEAKANVR